MQDRELIQALLQALVRELQRLNYWRELPPSPEQLASELPFCLDTLTFDQWLQWVFVANMQYLLTHQQPLPLVCAIAPVAVEVLAADDNSAALLEVIAALDAAIASV